MAQEVEAQLAIGTDAVQAGLGRFPRFFNGVGAQVGQLDALHVAPDQLYGVEVVGVARELLDQEPALGCQPGLHGLGAVGGQPVPDEGDLLAGEVAVQLFEELDQATGVVGVLLALEHEGGLGPVGAKRQGCRHRQPGPGEVVAQDGCLPFGGPGRPHRGEEGETALVLEDDPRLPAPGAFFIRGQSTAAQLAMAPSLRSRARRAGRWRDQPRRSRNIFQVWLVPYRTPVADSITSATRFSVHRSVENPLALGPAFSAPTTWASCSSERRGKRPARPAPARALRPLSRHRAYQRDALWGETPKTRATSAWDLPRRNMSAARRRRRCSASKSRRGRAGGLVLPVLARDVGEVRTSPSSHMHVVTSLYSRKIFMRRRRGGPVPPGPRCPGPRVRRGLRCRPRLPVRGGPRRDAGARATFRRCLRLRACLRSGRTRPCPTPTEGGEAR